MATSKFVIYNYNFARIIEPDDQYKIEFPNWKNVDVEESFKNKQTILNDILLSDYKEAYQFENAKKKEYWHRQIVKPMDDVYVMRVANVTNVTITNADLKDKDYMDYRNSLVIIDNRKGIQRIAIEKNSRAFSDTKTVANILQASFNKLLKSKLLFVELTAVYGTNVFWTIVKDYPKGFRKVSFHFPHLNLERLTKAMEKYLTTAREDWDSDLEFSFGANEGGVVKIDKENDRQNALINGASGAGTYIKMYPKDENRKVIYCGRNHFVTKEIDKKVIEELVSDKDYSNDITKSPMYKIMVFMNNIPDVFKQEE